MRRLPLGLSAFRLAAAVAAFALGLALAGGRVRPRPASQCLPVVVGVSTMSEKGSRDYSEYETCFDAGRRAEGTYHSNSYGFAFGLPDGLSPDSPARGVGPAPRLSEDAGDNSPVPSRLDAPVREHLRQLRQRDVDASVLGRTETSLAGLPAVRVVARYESDGEAVVSDEIIAVRREGREDVVYTMELSTLLSNYERDRPILEEMRKSFCLQPLP